MLNETFSGKSLTDLIFLEIKNYSKRKSYDRFLASQLLSLRFLDSDVLWHLMSKFKVHYYHSIDLSTALQFTTLLLNPVAIKLHRLDWTIRAAWGRQLTQFQGTWPDMHRGVWSSVWLNVLLLLLLLLHPTWKNF